MKHSFDFLVLASHGSGIHAFEYYSRMIKDIALLNANKLNKNNYVEVIDYFLKYNTHSAKGFIIDRGGGWHVQNQMLDHILENTSINFPLIVLVRDPIDLAISVANTTIYWWAGAVSGLFELDHKRNKFYTFSNAKDFFRYLLDAPTLNSVSANLPRLADKAGNIQVLHTSDLTNKNIIRTMKAIHKLIAGNSEFHTFDMPENLPWTRDNTFVSHVRKLVVPHAGGETRLQPCPEEFLEEYGFQREDIVLSAPPRRYNFGLGKFSGNISFVTCTSCDTARSALTPPDEIRNILENMPGYLEEYCTDLTNRNAIAQRIGGSFYYSGEFLRELARGDKEFQKKVTEYKEKHFSALRTLTHLGAGISGS